MSQDIVHDSLEAPLGATAERQAVVSAAGATPGQDWVIVTRGIKREYDMGGEVVRALRGVDVAIRRNEYVAIMGPSGSGKSTMLNIIGLLDRPTEGIYRLDDENVTALGDEEQSRVRREKIGFVFQFFHLLPSLTAFENVLVPMEIAGASNAPARATSLLHGRVGVEGVRIDTDRVEEEIRAGAVVLAIPAVALFVIFQRQFQSSDIGSGVKG